MSRDNTQEQTTNRRKRKKNNKATVIIVLIVVLVFFSRVSTLVKVKAEHQRLVKQQEELIKQRDLLKAKLKYIDSKDYIQEEARKQLKMMDPDEIMYVFEEE